MDWLVDLQFREIQREDMTILFQQPRPRETRFEIERLPGVRRAEPFRAVPARLRFEHRSRRVALLGLDRDAELHRLLDRDLARVPLPPDGLLLTAGLADVLGARPGDVVTAEVLEGARHVRRVVLAGVVDEPVGLLRVHGARRAGPAARRRGSRLGGLPPRGPGRCGRSLRPPQAHARRRRRVVPHAWRSRPSRRRSRRVSA